MNKIYCGNGKLLKFDNVGINICIDEIPKEHIKTAKNGKRYVNLNVCKKKEPDKYGNTHYVEVYVPKSQNDVDDSIDDVPVNMPFE